MKDPGILPWKNALVQSKPARTANSSALAFCAKATAHAESGR